MPMPPPTPDDVILEALAAPVRRWVLTVADCRRTREEAIDLLHLATDRVAAELGVTLLTSPPDPDPTETR